MNYFVIFCRKFANTGSFFEGFSLILSLTLFLLLVYEIQSKITVSDTSSLQIHSAWDQKEHEYGKTHFSLLETINCISKGESRTAVTSKMELFMTHWWSSLWRLFMTHWQRSSQKRILHKVSWCILRWKYFLEASY